MPPETLRTQVLRGPQTSQVSGPVNRDRADIGLLQGLESFSTELAQLGEFEKARKTANDILTARTAFEMDRQLPGSLEPEAEMVYNNMVALKTTRTFLKDFSEQSPIIANTIIQDNNIPSFSDDPNTLSKGAEYSKAIQTHYERFLNSAAFDEAQRHDVDILLKESRFKQEMDFTTLHAEYANGIKLASASEGMLRELEALRDDWVEADIEREIPVDQVFTYQVHDALVEKMRTMFPSGTKDDFDLAVIRETIKVASDPANIQPDMLNYLTEPRSDGRPRLSSIKALRSTIDAGITKVHALYKQQQKDQITAEKHLWAKQEREGEKLVNAWVIENGSKNANERVTDPLIIRKILQGSGAKQSVINKAIEVAEGLEKSSLVSNNNVGATSIALSDIASGEISARELQSHPAYINGNSDQKIALLLASSSDKKEATTKAYAKIKDYYKEFESLALKYEQTIANDSDPFKDAVLYNGFSDEPQNLPGPIKAKLLDQKHTVYATLDAVVKKAKKEGTLDTIDEQFVEAQNKLFSVLMPNFNQVLEIPGKAPFSRPLDLTKTDAEKRAEGATPRPVPTVKIAPPPPSPQEKDLTTFEFITSEGEAELNKYGLPKDFNAAIHLPRPSPAEIRARQEAAKRMAKTEKMKKNLELESKIITAIGDSFKELFKDRGMAPFFEEAQKRTEERKKAKGEPKETIFDKLTKGFSDLGQDILNFGKTPDEPTTESSTTELTGKGKFEPSIPPFEDKKFQELNQPKKETEFDKIGTGSTGSFSHPDIGKSVKKPIQDRRSTGAEFAKKAFSAEVGQELEAERGQKLFDIEETKRFAKQAKSYLKGTITPKQTMFIAARENVEKPSYKAGYFNGEDFLTIGHGISAPVYKKLTGKTLTEDTVISNTESKKLMAAYIATSIAPLIEKEFPFLKSNQRAAVISLLYNIGENNFKYAKKGKKFVYKNGKKVKTKAYAALLKGDHKTFKVEAFGPKGFTAGGLLLPRRQLELKLYNKDK